MFNDEIQAAVGELSQVTHHREISEAPGYHRLGPTQKFRYSLIYKLEGTTINLIAISAPERRPGYWRWRKI